MLPAGVSGDAEGRDDAETFNDPLFADRAKANLFAPTGAGRRREGQALGTPAGAADSQPQQTAATTTTTWHAHDVVI